MTEYTKYDMNEVVQDALIGTASRMPFLADVCASIASARDVAQRDRDSEETRKDLLTQVIEQMGPDVLATGAQHIARNEIYSSPVSLAYAFIAHECGRWLGLEDGGIDIDDPQYADVLEMNGLGYYEQGGHGSRENDVYLLDDVLSRAEEELREQEELSGTDSGRGGDDG